MKKIIISFLFIVNIISFSHAEIVNKIEVNGNKRISKETIIVFGEVIKGEDYDQRKLNGVLNSLYNTDFFSDVKLSLDNGVLNINVVENPIIKNIIFNGVKASKYIELINEIITLKEKSSFKENKLIDDINRIKANFRLAGFYFVKIDTYKKEHNNNSIDLIYEIDLGEKARIKKIDFIGDKVFKTSKLRNVITSEESKPWKVISSKKFLNETRLESDKRLLEVFYKNKGYYEVNVSATNVNYSKDKGFHLTFNINAGTRFKINKATLIISDDYNKDDFQDIQKRLDKTLNKFYSLNRIKEVLDSINKLSEIKDYQFLTSKLLETIDDEFISIEIEINQSEKLFVERINIFGNTITNENVIRGELLLDEGDPFNNLILKKSINNLKSRRIFSKVVEKTKSGSSPDLKVIDIKVEEQATGEISVGAGVGTMGASIAFNISENNFMGNGIILDTALSLTEKVIQGRISVTNPNYKYSGNSLTTSFSTTQVDRSQDFGYQTNKTEASASTYFEQYEDIFLAPKITASYENLKTDAKASTSMKNQKGTYTDVYLDYSLIKDKRDQRFQTSEGYVSSFKQSIPLYASQPTILNGYDFSTYYSLKENIIASIKFHTEVITSLSSSKDVRISKRLAVPSRMLRGFEAGKVGPKDGGDYIGGNYVTALSLQTSFPKLFSGLQNADFSLFLDTANVWGVDYSDSMDDSSKIRSAVGISANWFTLVGPLSFSLSQPLSKASTDITETFRFNLGTTF